MADTEQIGIEEFEDDNLFLQRALSKLRESVVFDEEEVEVITPDVEKPTVYERAQEKFKRGKGLDLYATTGLLAYDVGRGVVSSALNAFGGAQKKKAKTVTGEQIPVMDKDWDEESNQPVSREDIGKSTHELYMDKDLDIAEKIFKEIQSKTGEELFTDDFQYSGMIPTEASFEKNIGKHLEELYPGDENKELRQYKKDVIYTALMRKKQKQLLSSSEFWKGKGEKIFPQEEKLHNLYLDLDELTNPDMIDVLNIRKGWKIGGFNAKLSKMLGRTALLDPEAAKDLIPLFSSMKEEAESSRPNVGRMKGMASNVASILNPMFHTGVKTAVGNVIFPFAGTLVGTSEWSTMAMGDMFMEQVQAGVSPDRAIKIAIPFGIIHGFIEYFQVAKFGKFGKTIFKKNMSKHFAKAIAKQMNADSPLGGLMMDHMKTFGAEEFEEMLQGAVEGLALETGKKFEGLDEVGFQDYLRTSFKRFIKTGIESAPEMFFVTLLTGTGGQIAGRIGKQKGEMERITRLIASSEPQENKNDAVHEYLQENPKLKEDVKNILETYLWANTKETQVPDIKFEPYPKTKEQIEEQIDAFEGVEPELEESIEPEDEFDALVEEGIPEEEVQD